MPDDRNSEAPERSLSERAKREWADYKARRKAELCRKLDDVFGVSLQPEEYKWDPKSREAVCFVDGIRFRLRQYSYGILIACAQCPFCGRESEATAGDLASLGRLLSGADCPCQTGPDPDAETAEQRLYDAIRDIVDEEMNND